MSSHAGQSFVSHDDEERKTVNLYTEMNERFKIMKERMEEIVENFKELAELTSHTDTVLPLMMVALKSNFPTK